MQNITSTISSSIPSVDVAEFNKLNTELSNITTQLSEVNIPTE